MIEKNVFGRLRGSVSVTILELIELKLSDP